MATKTEGSTTYDEKIAPYSDHSSQDGAHSRQQPAILSEVSPAEARKIKLKIDTRLVLVVGFMYCISLMDRTNLANAKVAGMEKPRNAVHPKTKIPFQGLNLIGFRYNIMTLVFFPTYIIFQIPSTVIVRALGPRLHLASITILWGAVMIGMAFVNNWKTMAGMRVLLGVLEAGFFPSCVYLLSTWYTRYDMGKRYSIFYIVGCGASAFAGILAYGLIHLAPRWNLAGWRWIFLVEGIITCGVAVLGYVLLVGFPDQWKKSWRFLEEREVLWVMAKVDDDRGDAQPEPFSMRKYLGSALDWKIWAFAMIFFNSTTMSYALAYFGPDILHNQLKYDEAMTQIMGAPPYVFAGAIMFITGWFGDRFHLRGPIILFNMALCCIGLPMLGWLKNPQMRYFGLFLVTAGANGNIPSTMTYQANNIRGQWKRAFCSATLVGFGGIGGIAGSLVFRTKDAKTGYKPGLWACLACSLLNVVIVSALTLKFVRDNRRAEAGKLKIEGDNGFRYTV